MSFTGRLAGRRGFTLLELLITLSILATLAVLAVPPTEMLIKKKREHELMMALREIRGALDAYKRASDQGRIRTSLGQSGYPPSLKVLVTGTQDTTAPEGTMLYFLRRIPADPFYTGPTVAPEETWALRSYASPHDQPQPGVDVFDIHSQSTEVGSNGIAYNTW